MSDTSEGKQHVPGYPNLRLSDRSKVYDFLNRDLYSKDLDRMADRLWWMSKQDSSSISPLHRQLVKRRTVVITEDPKLHLVWIHDRIFIKPLPRYLTSHDFWQGYLIGDGGTKTCPESVRRAALGFVRTYFHLIQYESDLRVAQSAALQLIPADVTWEQFCSFASDFTDIKDSDVSPRYAYGEIRLTRLNFYAPLLLRKLHFQRVDYQYGSYFARFFGPILFAIGVASVVLSALQVCVAVQQEQGSPDFSGFALWFSAIMIAMFLLIAVVLCSIWVFKIIKEWKFAIRNHLRLMEERLLEEGKTHV